jgi:mono/diheme cytochrome c family protein
MKMSRVYRRLALTGLLMAAPSAWAAAASAPAPLVVQGEYVYRAAGCFGCHTDHKNHGKPLAGGRPLATPFGTFYTPNITPDAQTGIGKWSERDFTRALREGLDRSGKQLYPAFPYPAYSKLSDQDIHALWAYLRSVAPVRQANKAHDLKWYVPRPLVRLWKALYFTPGAYQPDPKQSPAWNCGAYLAQAAAHCGECHTPRNAVGGSDPGLRHAGTRNGPDNSAVPNITPDKKTGIGKWSASDLAEYLESGMMPDGDTAGDLMAEVIDDGLQYLRKDDLAAIADYVTSLPAVEHAVGRAHKKKKPAAKEDWE